MSRQAEYNDKRNVFNKSYLLETIVRNRIKDSIFYKQYLYLTNEQTILPVIIDRVKYIKGLDNNNRPSPFICCLLRLLEINPPNKIIQLYLKYPQFKYLTALILIFIRLTKPAIEIYTIFDGYYTNYRKLRTQLTTPKFDNGIPINFGISHIDELVDELIIKDRVVDIILPRLASRETLVEKGLINERIYHVTILGTDYERNYGGAETQENHQQEASDFESDSD